MSQDGQTVLSGQFTQHVDQLILHASLLPEKHRLTPELVWSWCPSLACWSLSAPAYAESVVWCSWASGTGSSSNSAGWSLTSAATPTGNNNEKWFKYQRAHNMHINVSWLGCQTFKVNTDNNDDDHCVATYSQKKKKSAPNIQGQQWPNWSPPNIG